jgi:hypothetical protein
VELRIFSLVPSGGTSNKKKRTGQKEKEKEF